MQGGKAWGFDICARIRIWDFGLRFGEYALGSTVQGLESTFQDVRFKIKG